MPVSNHAACVIERDFIYLAQTLDALLYPSRFTRMTFFLGEDAPVPWMAHDLHWQVVSVCVWRDSPFGGRVYVSLSRDGDVELLGPSERPNFAERIADRIVGPGTGFRLPQKLSGMRRVRQIGRRLYACGIQSRVFRRDGEGWEVITPPTSPTAPDSSDEDFNDLNGPDEDNVYAVGSQSLTRYRVAFFDGSEWRDLVMNLPSRLTTVSVSDRGGVYVAGSEGLLLYGDHRRGFTPIWTNQRQGVVFRAMEFNGALYVATEAGLFSNPGPGQPFRRVVTGLNPELKDTTMLDVTDGVLWCFGRKDLAVFDGHTWTRVHDPENPRIGR